MEDHDTATKNSNQYYHIVHNISAIYTNLRVLFGVHSTLAQSYNTNNASV